MCTARKNRRKQAATARLDFIFIYYFLFLLAGAANGLVRHIPAGPPAGTPQSHTCTGGRRKEGGRTSSCHRSAVLDTWAGAYECKQHFTCVLLSTKEKKKEHLLLLQWLIFRHHPAEATFNLKKHFRPLGKCVWLYIRIWGSMVVMSSFPNWNDETSTHKQVRRHRGKRPTKIRIICCCCSKKLKWCYAMTTFFLKIRVRDERFQSCQLVQTVERRGWADEPTHLNFFFFFIYFVLLFSASRPHLRKKNSNLTTMRTMQWWWR